MASWNQQATEPTEAIAAADVAVMLTTLVLSVFADISLAVEVGIILALRNFFRRMVSAVEVRSLGEKELATRLSAEQAASIPDGVLVYSVDSPFFFGAVEELESALLRSDTDRMPSF